MARFGYACTPASTVLTGRDLYLKRTIPAGPTAWQQAEQVREELIREIEEGRQPRTNATLGQLVDEHLTNADIGRRAKQTLQTHITTAYSGCRAGFRWCGPHSTEATPPVPSTGQPPTAG